MALNNLPTTALSILFLLPFVQPANIFMAVTLISSYSHHVGLETIAHALAERGHNVTFMSPFRGNFEDLNGAVTQWFPKNMKKDHEEFCKGYGVLGLQERVAKRKSLQLMKGFQFFDFAAQITEKLLRDKDYQDFLKSADFDLFLVDRLIRSEAFYALAWKLKAKLITYSAPSVLFPADHYLQGIPPESSWNPLFGIAYASARMTFWDRMANEVAMIWWYYAVSCDDSNLPSNLELVTMEKIVLFNYHYSDSFPKSLPPFFVPVGGIGAKTKAEVIKLPEDLESFISSSDQGQGFIYISFGSIISISSLPKETLQVFVDALSSTEFRYMWKWEGQIPENGPSNVLFRNWFPQSDVLGHPKIKGFINQGGQVSISEAVYHGVPMIIFPVNGDQDLNAIRAEAVGNGIPMEFNGLSSPELSDAIQKLTTDPKIRAVASRLSRASKNRPMSALHTAVWWAEFVLAEDDVSYLKPAMDYNTPWWIQRNFDVMLFLSLTLFLALVSLVTSTVYFLSKVIKVFQMRRKLQEKVSAKVKYQ